MAISVQPTPDEISELRAQALAQANDMSDWLSQNQDAPDYFDRAGQLRTLIAQLDLWESQGIDIDTSSNLAGTAVDSINAAISAMEAASQTVKNIGNNINEFGALVDWMVAISSGNPSEIISKGIALRNAANKAAQPAAVG